MEPWFVQERFWEATFDFMFPSERIDAAPAEVEQILQLVGKPVSHALDLCCGPGRYAVPMAQRGIQVTGVDTSSFLLSQARDRASAEAVSVQWVQEDMRSFERPDTFDLAVNLFTSFGYFQDPDDNRRVLERVRRSLKRDGAFVMEMMSKERIARVFLPSSVDALPDGQMMAQRRKVVDGWSRMENEWFVLQDGHYERFAIDHFLYSGQELKALLLGAGFGTVDLYGGFDGVPFDGFQRLVAVARV